MIIFEMVFFEYILLVILIACSLAVSLARKVIVAIIIFMSFSIVMAIVWVLLNAPDLALTEAAIGAGVTSLLFFVAIKRMRMIDKKRESEKETEDAGQ